MLLPLGSSVSPGLPPGTGWQLHEAHDGARRGDVPPANAPLLLRDAGFLVVGDEGTLLDDRFAAPCAVGDAGIIHILGTGIPTTAGINAGINHSL